MSSKEASAGAKLLRSRLKQRATARDTAIPAQPRGGPLPLSFSQQRLWALDRLRPGGTDYLVPIVLRLSGPLSPPELTRALADLVRRHEILRTRYATDDSGEPVQIIEDDPHLPVDFTDLSTKDNIDLEAVLAEEAWKPFDLATGPVLRARLIRLSPEEHVLAIIVHHIAMDGWSATVLVRELEARFAGRDLPPLTVQYADFAAWQREQLSAERTAHTVEYWLKHLESLPPLELPTDRPRPAVWDPRGDTIRFEIPAEVGDRVGALARENQATPFMAYLAAFWALLSRYTGQDDFAVGTPVAGRTHTETEAIVGIFINMLVLRADLSGDPTFRELLGRARTCAIDAFAHQEVPFERLVAELATDRDLSSHPLFGVNFVMQNTEPVRFAAGGVTGEEIEIASRSAKFDLTWTLEERPDGSVAGEVTFGHALLDAATAERMARHYVRLLQAAVTDPGRRIGDLPLLSENELRDLVRGPVSAAPDGPCLHERFAEQARRNPDALALTFEGEHLTYRELDTRANQLAHQLRALGAGREELVGVCLRRGANTIVAILGALKAGAAYLPLDPDHPAERIAYILEDAGARVAVTEQALTDRVPALDEVLVLDDPEQSAVLAALPATAPETGAHPGDLAYVIYTSGSTGRPKGVQVTHSNVVRLLTSTEEEYRFNSDDVWVLFHSYAFDVSVWEIWGTFLYGGRLVVPSYEVTRSPWDLVRLLADEGVTVLNQTPSAFRVLVELAERGGDPALDRLQLRYVILAGEAVDVATLKPWWDRFGDTAPLIVNKYGITETTVHVTYRPLRLSDLDGDRSPVGHPMRDLTMYILDGNLRPVPVGVPGEIYVGGPGVTRGYLDRPALTAQRYVPDPYGPPGARLYKSGDKARVLPNGDIGFLGRFDHQVKIRGFRIELGEVESCLSGHPDVEAAVVVVHESAPGDRRLVAYLHPKDSAQLTPADIRAYAAQELPSYMVPAIFMLVPKLPLTVNGKVDRRALPSPEGARQEPEQGYVAPRTAAERAVVEVWSRILGIARIGMHDNFFTLGGDSIRAIRLVGALREAGHEFSVQDLFRHQTIAELVRGGGETTAEETGTAPFSLLREEDRAALPGGLADAYPMSMVQVGMISEMVADRRRNLYHNITSYLIRDEEPFSLDALRAAIDTVVSRHEVLRTSFDLTSYREPLQLVHRAASMRLGCDDLRGKPEAEREAVLREFRETERAEPFDLANAPLVRIHVHRVSDDRWFLNFTECHSVLDGWSHNSLITELLACYRALRAGQALPANPAPEVRFADFIAAERRALADAGHREFWADRLGSADQLTIPASWADPDGEPFYELTLPIGDLEPKLRELADTANASLKAVLVAAHTAVWAELTGRRPFFCGLVGNGRLEVEGGDLVRGMFLNTLPFVAPTGPGTWRELVRAAFAEEVEVWGHRRFPMPAIQRAFGDGTRLLEVVFNYLDFHILDREAVDTAGSVDLSPNEFSLEVSTQPGQLVFSAQSQWIGRAHTELLTRLYRRALEAMAADPDGNVRSGLITEEESLLRAHPGDFLKPVLPRTSRPRTSSAHVAPSGDAEETLAAVWAQVLGLGRIGATDDFFALGGDSLLMMRIIIRLREEHGIELAFRDFVEHRTVRAIAAHATGGAQRPALVWHTKAGEKPTLFCVHPGGGSAHWYQHLADAFAGDRPLAAFEWPGLNGTPESPRSVEATAARYLAELRAAQPHGRYHLLGWCGGGGITWEMARTLRAEGEDVHLVLMDPVAVSADGTLPRAADLDLFRRGEALCEVLRRNDDAEARAELGDILREVIEDDRGTPLRAEDIGPQWLARLRTWRELVEVERAYRFAGYPGSLDLIVCDELVSGEHVAIVGQPYDDYVRNWSAHTSGELRIHRIPGDHLGVLRPPHVAALHEVLTGLLDGKEQQ
ncbi:non-ribosomal peptide synthetase [Amycolatopsis anabasis]|uniref:non-ribosomal peptide synthetase n=1 Tax=Amycolatopsis anabasis TaxID=1840409 RepID=UPI00131DF99D|nr:non-ribosomal peptide synthetase [Amycolatopsis anabasis]